MILLCQKRFRQRRFGAEKQRVRTFSPLGQARSAVPGVEPRRPAGGNRISEAALRAQQRPPMLWLCCGRSVNSACGRQLPRHFRTDHFISTPGFWQTLYAAGFLPEVWTPDAETEQLRRPVTRRNQVVKPSAATATAATCLRRSKPPDIADRGHQPSRHSDLEALVHHPLLELPLALTLGRRKARRGLSAAASTTAARLAHSDGIAFRPYLCPRNGGE